MSNRKNISEASAGVNCIVDGVATPNMQRDSEQRYDVESIITYVKHSEPTAKGRRAAANALVESLDKHMPNGENFVYIVGCDYVFDNETGNDWYALVLRNKELKVEVRVNLFPGKEYTDRLGVVHPEMHNWESFGKELKNQLKSRGLAKNAVGGLEDLFKAVQTFGFTTWLLWDGKHDNMYATNDKYQYALDRLVREQKAGEPKK